MAVFVVSGVEHWLSASTVLCRHSFMFHLVYWIWPWDS